MKTRLLGIIFSSLVMLMLMLVALPVYPMASFGLAYAQDAVQSTGPPLIIRYHLFACHGEIASANNSAAASSNGFLAYNPILLNNKTLQFDASKQTGAVTIPLCIISTYPRPTRWSLSVLPVNPSDPNNKEILPHITFDKNPIVIPAYKGPYPDQDVSMLEGQGKSSAGNFTTLNAFLLIPATMSNGDYSFEIQSAGNSTDQLITGSDINIRLDIPQATSPEFNSGLLL